MQQRLSNRTKPPLSTDTDEAVHHEPTVLDRDWELVGSSSESAPELSEDAHNERAQPEQPRGPFLPLTESPAPIKAAQDSYAAKLRTGLAEQQATAAAIDQLTASVKAQSADLAKAVNKLNQEREMLAEERKRLQDKNITEQAEIHAQFNRQFIAMQQSVMAKVDEEMEKLRDRVKKEFDAQLTDMAKEFQEALDGEAKKRRRGVEELQDRAASEKKARDARMAGVEHQHRALQQQLSSMEQRISTIEQRAWSTSCHERAPSFVQQDRAQQSRPTGPSSSSRQSRSTGPAPRSQRHVSAANSSAQRQRAEGSDHGMSVSQDAMRAHAMHVAYSQHDYDCDFCA